MKSNAILKLREKVRRAYRRACDLSLWLMQPASTDECHKDDYSKQRTENQTSSANRYQLIRGKFVKHMWPTILCLAAGTILAVGGIIASLNARDHHTIAVWVTYLGVLIALIVPFKAWDDSLASTLFKNQESSDNRREQRARIVVTHLEGVPTREGPGQMTVTFENVGKTPAQKVRGFFYVRFVDVMDEPTFEIDDDPHPRGSESTLAPGYNAQLYISQLGSYIPTEPPTEKDWGDFDMGIINLFVSGKITYEDTFGISHWVTFCYQWDKSASRYRLYKAHNEFDKDGP